MSFAVDVLLAGVDEAAVLRVLESHFGIKLPSATAEACATLEIFGVVFSYSSNHDLVDDCGIKFSQYPILVGVVRYALGGLEPESGSDLCRAMARVVARTIRQETGAAYLLVEEVQRVIERAD